MKILLPNFTEIGGHKKSLSIFNKLTGRLVKFVDISWTRSLFCVLMRCITPANALSFYGCNSIAQWSPTCFGHLRGHLEGAENKNTDTIKMCLDHFTV